MYVYAVRLTTSLQLTLVVAPHVPSLPIAQSDEISTEHAPSTTSAFPFGAPYPFSQNNAQTKLQGRVGRLGGFSTDAVTAETHFNNFATQISNAEVLGSTTLWWSNI